MDPTKTQRGPLVRAARRHISLAALGELPISKMDSSLHGWAQTKGRTITDVLFGAQIFTMRSTTRAHGPGAQHGGIGAWRSTPNEDKPRPTFLREAESNRSRATLGAQRHIDETARQ